MSDSPNRPGQILFASLVGTTIEFFDFYIYATAAVLVFPRLFFPATNPAAATLASLATFAIAFLARPIGSALFGHYGDRIGRKATLVASLLTMGVSTVTIGLPAVVCVGRSRGAVPPGALSFRPGTRPGWRMGRCGAAGHRERARRKARVVRHVPDARSADRVPALRVGLPAAHPVSLGGPVLPVWMAAPFITSAVLVLLGLYVRLTITETPVFARAVEHRVRVPMLSLFRDHWRALIVGVLVCLSVFVLFYLLSVFALTWGTTELGYTRTQFLEIQLLGVVFFGLGIPVSARIAERGRRNVSVWINVGIGLYGFAFAPMFAGGIGGVVAMMVIGLLLGGLIYGPLGTLLSELFPTSVRYSGVSLAFNLAGIVGASVAPYIATALARAYGLKAVGFYVTVSALLSLLGLWLAGETKDRPL
jgi:MFS family permease